MVKNSIYVLLFFFVFFLFYSCLEEEPKLKKIRYIEFSGESDHIETIEKYSDLYSLDKHYVKAVIIKESNFDQNAISITGAVGLMQLMPREKSYITENYKNYLKARKSKNRTYENKTSSEWGKLYQNDLRELYQKYKYDLPTLQVMDKRFDPVWNIEQGTRQLSGDYQFFLSRKHSHYKSRILASSAYNSGRFSVGKDRPKFDSIPINGQTEFYAISVEKIFQILTKNGGKIPENSIFLY